MNERIKEIRKDAGLTLEKFGERIGITASSCSYLESGKNNPSTQTIALICRVFCVNEEWLRYGTGEKYRKKARGEELAEIFADLEVEETTKARFIRALAGMPDDFFEPALKLLNTFLERFAEEEQGPPGE